MTIKMLRAVFFLAVLVILGTACTQVFPILPADATPVTSPQATADPKGPYFTPTPTLFDSAACEERLIWVLAQAEADLYTPDDLKDVYRLVTYSIIDNRLFEPTFSFAPDELIPYQDDTARHEELWAFASSLMDNSLRYQVTNFLVYTDGEGETLGAVRPLDIGSWQLALDIRDAEDPGTLALTLVHETAHLLTLNNDQVVINRNLLTSPDNEQLRLDAKQDCTTFFTNEGCAKPDSYMNEFFQQFWPEDLYTEWLQADSAGKWEEYIAQLEAFYAQHTDLFVSDYAVKNPMEDIAESFMFYVFTPRPTGTSVADQKIRFFYDQPGLASMRTSMLKALCRQLP